MLCHNIFQKNTILQSQKRTKDKAASLKKNAAKKLAREQEKADNQSGSGKIIPDDPSPPDVPADDDVDNVAPPDDDVDNVAPPAFIFRFKLGDSVETRPDTQPGVRGYHGESFVGSVAALDYTTRFVTIKSCYNGHMHTRIASTLFRGLLMGMIFDSHALLMRIPVYSFSASSIRKIGEFQKRD